MNKLKNAGESLLYASKEKERRNGGPDQNREPGLLSL